MRNEFFDKFIIEVKKQSRKGTNVRPAADFMLIAVPIWLILTRSKNLKHSIETWDARRNTRAAGFTHVVRYGRTSAPGSAETPSLLDGASHGPAGRWVLLRRVR